jgi:alpha-galactosidase
MWNSLGAALDLTHPGALGYVREVISTAVHQWGFPYLKLDFLYAAALKSKYQDNSKTRAQVLRLGMETIREAAGEETLLVGCGAPLGSMLGLADIMRIGPDVNASWTPSFAGITLPFKNEPSMPSARNSIQNIITRSPLHNRWWVNDPDCLLLSPDTKLTMPEIQSLATAIALTGGSLVVSDDMTQLPPERLRILASLLPIINKRPMVMDLFESQKPSRLRLDLEGAVGKWHLLAFFNWKDADCETELIFNEFGLSEGAYHLRSFWDDRIWEIEGKGTMFSGMISSHGVLLLAARKIGNSPATYIGSDLHISQGLEIANWDVSTKELIFSIKTGKKLSGKADLYIESPPTEISINNVPSAWEMLGRGIYRILIPEKENSTVMVKY